MSGLFAQLGFANELTTPPVATVGTSAAATIGGYPFINTLTFGSAHGLSVGNVLTIAGFTPGAWNGTWVVASVPSATTLTFLSTVTLGAASVFGTSSAGTYGVTATPTRFDTFVKESMKLNAGRITSVGVGNNRRVQSSTRFVVDRQGASGAIDLEVGSKGFGFWLKHMFGPVVTAGPTDSAYTHTASFPTTLPGMLGSSFTLQGTVVPPGGGGAEMVKTYTGCKVVSWQLNFAVGQLVTISLTIDGMDEQLNIVKATASYPASPELLSFAGATIQFGGTTWDVVKSGTIKVDMGYDTERRFARNNTLQKEPSESTFRQVTIDLDGEFDNVVTAYNRYAATAAANAIAQVNLAFVGKILIGATTFPSLTFNAPVARFEGDTPTTDGPGLPMQKVSCAVMWNEAASPLNAIYVTTDATP